MTCTCHCRILARFGRELVRRPKSIGFHNFGGVRQNEVDSVSLGELDVDRYVHLLVVDLERVGVWGSELPKESVQSGMVKRVRGSPADGGCSTSRLLGMVCYARRKVRYSGTNLPSRAFPLVTSHSRNNRWNNR